jgi:hypothetical protein
MIRAALRLAVLTAALALAAPAHAQTGHPAKGSWLGYWGAGQADQRRLFILLDWENREITGLINPGPDAVTITRAEIDYATWTMTLEADMPTADGGAAKWVATGKLENLGSWTNRRYSGTYTHGEESGEFSLTLN